MYQKKVFKKAFKQEWEGDFNEDNKIQYVYAVKVKNKKCVESFKQVEPDYKGAKPYTIQMWETV